MRYKLLGRSGLRVSELALGTMTFGEDWGWGASREESRRMWDRFVEAGGNFVDTSVNYTDGTSESFVGEFAAGERDRFVLATKYTLSRNWDDPNAGGNSRKNMMNSLETSLRRLRTDYIDLYWLHMWDYMTPIDEVLRGLDDAVRAGKVRYIGVSDTPAWVVSRANMLAELRGWSQFVALQIPYSLIRRDAERELLPMARALDIAVTPWAIVGSGILTGKYTDGSAGSRRLGDGPTLSDKTRAVVDEVRAIADETGRSLAQVAANWVRFQGRAQIIPLLGARSDEQLRDNLAMLEWTLTDEQRQRLDQASAIELGFPHDFLPANRYVFGNTFDQIDNHRA